MKLTNRLLLFYASLVMMLLISSCSKEGGSNSIKILYGPSVSIGNGEGRAWVSEDIYGNPTAVGIDLSEAALSNLPQMNQEYILTFDASSATKFFKFVSLDWS